MTRHRRTYRAHIILKKNVISNEQRSGTGAARMRNLYTSHRDNAKFAWLVYRFLSFDRNDMVVRLIRDMEDVMSIVKRSAYT